MSSISFSQAKDADLAWVDGQIHFSSSTRRTGGNENEDNKELNLVPVLDALAAPEVI